MGALAATVALAIAGATLIRAPIESKLVALQCATSIAAVDLLLVAQSFGNESAFDVALMLALLSAPAGLVYARFYERWL